MVVKLFSNQLDIRTGWLTKLGSAWPDGDGLTAAKRIQHLAQSENEAF
jgi:hypothetical protein